DLVPALDAVGGEREHRASDETIVLAPGCTTAERNRDRSTQGQRAQAGRCSQHRSAEDVEELRLSEVGALTPGWIQWIRWRRRVLPARVANRQSSIGEQVGAGAEGNPCRVIVERCRVGGGDAAVLTAEFGRR